jgi:DNA-binding XRE family transcriptional regulator
MLKKDEVKMIHKMLIQGLSKSEITKKLGINRNTVAKYAKLDNFIPIITLCVAPVYAIGGAIWN